MEWAMENTLQNMVELSSYLKSHRLVQTSTTSPVLVQLVTSRGLLFVCECVCVGVCGCPVGDIFISIVYWAPTLHFVGTVYLDTHWMVGTPLCAMSKVFREPSLCS